MSNYKNTDYTRDELITLALKIAMRQARKWQDNAINECDADAAEHYENLANAYRAIIEENHAQQAQEAPTTAPAADHDQQPTSTENAPQAATQAAEGIEITAITYTTDEDPTPAPGLLIHRPGTTRGIIIGDGVMLPDDPADLLTAYGEREYSRDAAGNYIITTDTDTVEEEDTMHNNFTPAEAAMHAATVAGIIRRQGGYRERIILLAPHDMTHGETWNADHKVVYVTETTPGPDGYRAGCAVDIVTRSIVG